MKILFLTQTSEKGPSSRIRGYQMAEALRRLGAFCVVSPGIPSSLYSCAYGHDGEWLKAPFYSWALLKRRFQINWIRKHFDAVVIQKPVVPRFAPLFERRLRRAGIPYIFDFDDAIYLRDKKTARIAETLQHAAAVTAGNATLAAFARCFSDRVSVIPSCIDPSAIEPKKAFGENGKIVLGWIGSRTSWPHLNPLLPALSAALERHSGLHLSLVADRLPAQWKQFVAAGKASFHRWSLEQEIPFLNQFDIGLAPLEPGPWSEGKCAYKLAQYLARGLPVIASPVGAQKEMVEEWSNGCFAQTPEEWVVKIDLLMSSRDRWERMGRASRHLSAKYDLSAAAKTFHDLLNKICLEAKAAKKSK